MVKRHKTRTGFVQKDTINRRNIEILDGSEGSKKLPGIRSTNKATPLQGRRSRRNVTRSSKVLPGITSKTRK